MAQWNAYKASVRPRSAKTEKLASYILEGQKIQNDVPSGSSNLTSVHVWIIGVESWVTETNNFLLTQCSPQASAIFLNDPEEVPVRYEGVHRDAHRWYVALRRRLNNIARIIERPEVYL
jgi:hypothetical protein